jgi:hypothetical protein
MVHYYVPARVLNERLKEKLSLSVNEELLNDAGKIMFALPKDTAEIIREFLGIKDDQELIIISTGEGKFMEVGYFIFWEWKKIGELNLTLEQLKKILFEELGYYEYGNCSEFGKVFPCGCEEITQKLHYNHPYPQTSPCTICNAGWVSWWDGGKEFHPCEEHAEEYYNEGKWR